MNVAELKTESYFSSMPRKWMKWYDVCVLPYNLKEYNPKRVHRRHKRKQFSIDEGADKWLLQLIQQNQMWFSTSLKWFVCRNFASFSVPFPRNCWCGMYEMKRALSPVQNDLL